MAWGEIRKIEFEYNGQVVDRVPVGERFDIYAYVYVSNPDGLFHSWEILCTCKSTDGLIAVYDTTWAGGDDQEPPKMKLDSLLPGFALPRMPDHDLSFVFKVWKNETRGENIPPINEW